MWVVLRQEYQNRPRSKPVSRLFAAWHLIDLDGEHPFAAVECDDVAYVRIIQQHRMQLIWLDWSV